MSRVLLLLGVVLILGGCHTKLMKTPTVVAAGTIDPFELVPPERQSSRVPVFVASARTVSGNTAPEQFYTNDRSREVRLGLATVEIAPGLAWDDLKRESRAEQRTRDLEIRLASYEEYGPLWSTAWPPDYRFDRDWNAPTVDREPADRFIEAVEDMLDSSRLRQITIFVHGFNTKFATNLEVAGEFWHYMARDGVMMSFDWPSKGNVFSYQVDKANADFAVRQFRRLLEFLAAHTSADQINIMAHSAGNPIAVEALRQMSLMHYGLDNDEARRRSKIGWVVLAAPDMDLDAALSAGVDGASRMALRFAIYASRRDRALGFSSGIFGDVRLGRSIGKLDDSERTALIAHGGQWIDVTAAQERHATFLGHSYFHENPWVSSDVMIFLRLGAPPEERGLVRDMETGFLVFPDDYEEQLPAIVDRLRRDYESTIRRPPAGHQDGE
jgi:esterase/lipase superfamily enzyme